MSSENRRNLLRSWVGMAVLLSVVLTPFLICSAAEKPRRGGTIVVGGNVDPTTMNPAITSDTNALRIWGEIFEGLIELDRDLKVLPGLAESWDISSSGLTITFHLVRNAKWHDGKPFTAKDVQFSLMEAVGKYHPRGVRTMADVKSIETPDDYTAVFHMKRVYAPFLIGLNQKTCPIIPRHIFEGTDILKNPSEPIGTGAFKFKEWVKGDHVTLVRNENYRKPGLPYLDRIIYKVIKDTASRGLAFEKGEIDYLDFWTMAIEDYGRLSSLPNVTSSPSHGVPSLVLMALNQKDNKILANLKVREALYHAIDRQFICNKARYGLNPPLHSPILSLFRDFYNPNVKKYDYNPAKANKLLDEAGYPRRADGVRFNLRLPYEPAFIFSEKPSQIMKPMLREVGINVILEAMDRPLILEKVFKGYNYDIFITGYESGGDPEIGLSRLYHTSMIRPTGYVNVARYSNPEVDRLFDAAASAMDQKERAKAYYRVQEILTEELPYLWLYEYAYDTNLVRSEFKNAFQRCVGPVFTEVWWTKGK